jgi:hypothetical protein
LALTFSWTTVGFFVFVVLLMMFGLPFGLRAAWATGLATWAAAMLFLFGAQRVRIVQHPRGRCAACGYDLKGLAEETPCPECGAQPQHKPPPEQERPAR